MELIKRATISELMQDGANVASMLAMGADNDEELDMVEDRFAQWLEQCEDKVTACVIVIKALEADADRYKAAAAALSDRRRSIEASADRLRERTMGLVELALESTGKKSMNTQDGGKATITTRNGLSVNVTEVSDLPPDCVRVTVAPDLAAIKAAFTADGDVPGAVVTHTVSKSLTVR